MKLSELILEGIKKDGYQIFGSYFRVRSKITGVEFNTNVLPPDNYDVIGCCTMGSALLAQGVNDYDLDTYIGNIICPAGCGAYFSIVHLNDDHKWTREAIAEFIASQGY